MRALKIDLAGPSEPRHRTSERHLGVDFGDHATSTHHWHVTLDGRYVEEFCAELLAGEDGWVRLLNIVDGTVDPTNAWRIERGFVRAWQCDSENGFDRLCSLREAEIRSGAATGVAYHREED